MAKPVVKRQAKPKTAYALLERVCEAIQAHPEAYYQGDWRASVGEVYRMDPKLVAKNTCGTAFCRAGWMVAVADGFDAAKTMRPGAIANRAECMLGFGRYHSDVHDLFDGSAVPSRFAPGTRAYIRSAVAGVRRFMKKHSAHLKARSLKGV